MTQERWHKVEELYHSALGRKPGERAPYLEAACAGDEGLLQEVESLLDNAEHSESFLEGRALEAAARNHLSALIPNLSGMNLGRYEVIACLGRGGMGEVYLARDTRLKREVALKVLPLESVADSGRRRRFEQEARAASALNHPNIVTIHDVDRAEGIDFIAMEYVAGKTLTELIGDKGLPLDQALHYAVQIAGALATAHGAGIVHRDIKPANIMVDASGQVKVLDFGLAKLTERAGDNGRATTQTDMGTVVGTVAYMSPEQSEGKKVDARSDIFSFGAVLYEMFTGRRAFQRDSTAATLAAILKEEPEPARELIRGLPTEVDNLLARCLRKEPEQRFQHIDDARILLEALRGGLRSGGSGAPAGARLVARPPRLSLTKSVGLGLGILASVIVLLIALNVGRLRERVLGRAGAPRIESLAVLPVKNFSGDPSQEFFADGMTDALIAGLAQIKAVKVISRTSVMQYKDAKKSLPRIARELGVDGIVEASVMRSGGRVRITAELIEARQDRHLWASKYEREMTDVLALQSDVVQMIADEIRVQVTPQESGRLKTARRVDPEAYDSTLNGKATLESATREGEFRQAIELFQKAIDRDPTYAPAWAGLGEALWSLAATGFEFVAPAEVRHKAIAAAETALELDETLADAHKARAVIAQDGEWDVAKAQQHYERALELRPGYAAAHSLYGQMLAGQPLLRLDEARRHLDRARELDPLVPWNELNLIAWWLMGRGQPQRAFEEGERARQWNPTLYIIPWQMGFAQLLLGQPSQAAPEFEAALGMLRPERPAAFLAPLGLAYGLAGRRGDALKILAEMEQASRKRYVSPYSLAVVYSGLGRMDEAFRLLDRAVEQRTPWLVICTPHDPESVALRRDPRWKPFMDRLRRLVRLPPGTPDPYS